jgi:hypothetical protein
MLGRRLLRGDIPVVPPSFLPTCPVPATHVKDFDNCCRDYVAGKLTDAEVLSRVGDMLKTMKKPPSSAEEHHEEH